MKRTGLIAVALLLAGSLIAAVFMALRPGIPDEAPMMTGTITKVDGQRVLVEELPGEQRGNKCWFRLDQKTQVFDAQTAKTQKASNADLTAGKVVKAWASGPVLESYPCQTGAGTMVITGVGQTGGRLALPDEQPLVTGSITQVDGNRVLVEGSSKGQACWFTVTEGALLMKWVNGQLSQASNADLTVGKRVQAWHEGAIMKSLPCQTGTKAILVE